MKTYTPQQFGAKGDGIADDTQAIYSAIDAAGRCNGCVKLEAGDYWITAPLLCFPETSVAIIGGGEGVTRLFCDDDGFYFQFRQSGLQQPHGLTIEGVSLIALGSVGTAISVNYNAPDRTSDHYRPSVRLSNVVIESGNNGYWANGIDIADAWNVTLDNVFVSGSSANGVWNNLSGTGINLRRMTVNAHFSNVRTNFWKTGIKAHADSRCNTEGLFFSNCSMVGVQRGLWVKGNPAIAHAPRISTVTWTGGLIEARVGGVMGGSAGFHLENVWDAKIVGVEMLTETITANAESTYGVIAQDCRSLIVSSCGFNAWTHGICITGDCPSASVEGNVFNNCAVSIQKP